jgi:hypothetical protein
MGKEMLSKRERKAADLLIIKRGVMPARQGQWHYPPIPNFG